MKAAVIGLGYVGLPTAIRLCQIGVRIVGIDKNEKNIEKLEKGQLPFAQNEPKLKSSFKNVFSKSQITFSDDFSKIKNCDIVFLIIDTPIKNRKPDLEHIKSAVISIATNLSSGTIVMIESTVSPGTTEGTIIPILEKYSSLKLNKDFFVGVAPERIRPNHLLELITTSYRIIGVSDKKIIPMLNKLYGKITSGKIAFTNIITTEFEKVVENYYRDVEIAIANEVAQAAEELGVNFWEIRQFVNQSPFHNMHSAGAGVGGHCLPKDPWLLASSTRKSKMQLLRSARYINDSMPRHILSITEAVLRTKNVNIRTANLAILGYSYVDNSDDTRNSPTGAMAKILIKRGISYKIYDPHVTKYSLLSIVEIAKNADALILMVAHDHFKKIDFGKLSKIMKTKIVIDGRNFFDRQYIEKKGFTYSGIGNTTQKADG